MDPTHKKQPKSTPFTTITTKPHPRHPDPSIQNISNHFSKLYTNHKVLSSLKASNGHSQPRIDIHLQAKSMAISTIGDSSTTSLTKSNHQRRRSVGEMGKESTRTTVAKVKETVKKPVKESHEETDIKKALESSQTDEIKKLPKKESEKKDSQEEGFEMKRTSVSSLALSNLSGGRRKSFCCSQTELADFLCCNGVKVVAVDMPPFMQIHAVDCARKTYDSLEKFTPKTLASTLKKEFDGVYGPAWHCIVGTSFGSFVTHSVGGFLYFSMDHKLYVLLFKTTVQRAD